MMGAGSEELTWYEERGFEYYTFWALSGINMLVGVIIGIMILRDVGLVP